MGLQAPCAQRGVDCVTDPEDTAAMPAFPAAAPAPQALGASAASLAPEPLSLRPHQAKAVRLTLRHFEAEGDGARGILEMACASGKTLTAQRIAERLDGPFVMVCVPTLALVAQTLEEWIANQEVPFRCLCVCSDQSVTGGRRVRPEHYGLAATTDSAHVAAFLDGAEEAPEEWSVIFCTYQSLHVAAEALEAMGVELDLLVCDEAHRTATGGKKGTGQFKLALDNREIPARRRLFLTATMRVYHPTVRIKAESVGYEVASMDDEELYGKVIYRFSFADAIRKRVLADYRLIVLGVKSSEIRELIQSRAFVNSHGEAVDAATIATHLALAKAIRRFGLKKIVVYHSRIDDARKFSDPNGAQSFIHTLGAAGLLTDRTVWTASVDSQMRAGRRMSILDRLRQDNKIISVVSNARCLTEGVNVPALDAVMFTHPKRSAIDIIQAVGRALRIPQGWEPRHPGDHPPFGHVIIPVVVDDEDPDASIDASDYDAVATVLRQLRCLDDRLGEMIDTYRVSQGVRLVSDPWDTTFSKKVEVDLPDGYDAEELVAKIRTKIVELSADFWQSHYNALKDWARETGHARPSSGGLKPVRHKGRRIGDWVGRQRTLHRKGGLSQVRVKLLEELPRWSWDPHQEAWDQRVAQCRSFYAGEIERPRHFHKWVSRCREQYARGLLGAERVAELEEIAGWRWYAVGTGNRGHRKVLQRPTEKQILEDLAELGAFTLVGEKYGVSDNAVRKWLISDGWTRPRLKILGKRSRKAKKTRG